MANKYKTDDELISHTFSEVGVQRVVKCLPDDWYLLRYINDGIIVSGEYHESDLRMPHNFYNLSRAIDSDPELLPFVLGKAHPAIKTQLLEHFDTY
jgi:hypothetical protein